MGRNKILAAIDGIESIDHMTHVDNLESIFKYGLLSHNNPYKQVDISNQEVNSRRNKIEPIYGQNIHDYVPLYFNPRNAMLYRNQNFFGDDIIILAFKKDILLLENSIFTNGNAASDATLYSNDINKLSKMEWDKISSRSWNGHEDQENIKWSMMAEVLVYEKLDTKLMAIYCSSNKTKQHIESKYPFVNIEVSVNKYIFF